MKVTSANASNILAQIEADEAKARASSPGVQMTVDEHGGAQATMVMGAPDEPPGDETTAPSESPVEEKPAGEQPLPDEEEDPKALESLQKKFGELEEKHAALQHDRDVLDGNFRRIQREITPVQQENARLRQENKALTGQLSAQAPSLGDLEDEIEAFSELYPESAAKIKQALAKQASASDEPSAQTAADKAIASIQAAHADTPLAELSRDIGFWAFVRKRDAESWELRNRFVPPLAAEEDMCISPWEHPRGVETVIELISSYKALKAAAPAAPPPEPPPPAREMKRPSDTAPAPIKPSVPIRPGSKNPSDQLLSDAQLEGLQRELRRASPSRGHEIIKILEEQSRLNLEVMAGS